MDGYFLRESMVAVKVKAITRVAGPEDFRAEPAHGIRRLA